MKIKGYISVLALIVSLLVFSVITAILVGVEFDIIANKNEKDYYQNCLISESIANKIKYNEEVKESLNEIFKNMVIEKKYMDLYYDEIVSDGKTKLEIEKQKDDSIKINYNIKFNNTSTKSTIIFLKKEMEVEENIDIVIPELEEKFDDEGIIDKEDQNNSSEIQEELEKKIEIIYEFSKYWIN